MNRLHFDAGALEKLKNEAIKRAQEAVMAAEKIIIEGGLTVSGTVAAPPTAPKELILKEANDWGANLIVVGSHGQSGFTRLLLGSVSEAVATLALCSVEVIRRSRN